MEISYPLVNYHSHGQSPFLLGKLTIPMVIFNSELWVYQRVSHHIITIPSPFTTIFSPFTTILSPLIITIHHHWSSQNPPFISSSHIIAQVGLCLLLLGCFRPEPLLGSARISRHGRSSDWSVVWGWRLAEIPEATHTVHMSMDQCRVYIYIYVTHTYDIICI